MDDLLKRLRKRGDHNRYLGKQNYVPSMRHNYTAQGDMDHKAADRIAALEAKVAAADALADAVGDGLFHRWSDPIRNALAAYRGAGKTERSE